MSSREDKARSQVEQIRAYLNEHQGVRTQWSELPRPLQVEGRLFLPDRQATTAALALYHVDLETRRAAHLLSLLSTPESASPDAFSLLPPEEWLTPARPSDGGLTVERAEPGSLEVYLLAYGLVSQFLLSDPVQLTLTMQQLLGWAWRLTVRVRKPNAPEETIYEQKKGEYDWLSPSGARFRGRTQPGARLEYKEKTADGTEITFTLEP